MDDNQSAMSLGSSQTRAIPLLEEPSDWCKGLLAHSEQSPSNHLHSGDHLEWLAEYLNRPFDRRLGSRLDRAVTHETDFVVAYQFLPDACTKETLWTPSDINKLPGENEPHNQLLFMRGHPSPEWVNAIASKFSVSAEFFFHHLELFSRRKDDQVWTWPALKSQSTREPRLRLTTIGTMKKPGDAAHKDGHVHKIRKKVRSLFEDHLKDMRNEENVRIGTSLLRDVSIHDAKHFSLGQDVSMWTRQTSHGWFAIAWLDIGTENIVQGPQGSFLRTPLGGDVEDTSFSPVIFRQEGQVALESSSSSTRSSLDSSTTTDGIRQSTEHLCHQYSDNIDPSLAYADSFYALSNVFTCSAASQNQFLNMMQSIVKHDIRQATVYERDAPDHASLSNLFYNQMVLSDCVERLKENVATIERRQAWPRSQLDTDWKRIERKGAGLMDDYCGLLQKAQGLAEDCDRGIRNVEHLASHAESKKAIAQAKGVERLTRLAFVFVPMSFTATFFGMNFKEVGQGQLPIWVWFVVTVPICVVSLVLMISRLRHKILGLAKAMCRTRRQPEHDVERGR
ncbi:hypothetical protein DOTSEDRAFT_36394 [Dothistroma septosporum NZE10]|uniref:Uncharacterized protein n=1 Tax=Dothistroma septosporum (strain NZE10 / CBS 128990) TaxID=675120 RepID=N1PJF2_DOTSN|nr:hypothetical protein DOTSEDRAFT_36394 [Dothistroma septosporum NZE10]